MKKKYGKTILIILLTIFIIGIYQIYSFTLRNNVAKEGKLFIPTNATLSQVLDSLQPYLKHPKSFEWYAKYKNYNEKIYPGRYTLTKGMSTKELVNLLKSGKQDEIAVRIGNYTSIYEIASKIAPFLETDSTSIVNAIKEHPLSDELSEPQMLYWMIPNTYNFHWNTSGTQFASKMANEYNNFWNDSRKEKMKAIGYDALKITILASIVQKESSKADEQPKVAGLYLNRLKKGMRLEADPTIIFAKQLASGFTENIKRVYFKDLKINSPYNTYLNSGLPPSPICMPNPSAIDAVLAPERHDYLFFVADTQRPGYHLFAKTFAEHQAFAKVYRQWLNDNQIQ